MKKNGSSRIIRQRASRLLSCAALVIAFSVFNLATAAVRFDVFPGYDGIVPEASWFPFVFEVANDGPGFNAVVEVVPTQFDSSQSRRMAVELPTGTTKRLVIPVFSAARYVHEWDARLLDERGKVQAEITGLRARKINSWKIPLAGSITRTPISLPEIKVKNNPDLQPIVARIQTGVFPDNPIALEGLGTLYVSSEKAMDLSHNQAMALLGWIYHGGHLIVGIEQIGHVNGTDWLRKFVPVELTGMTMLSAHSGLQQWLVSNERHDGTDYSSRETEAVSLKKSYRHTTEFKNPYAELRPDDTFEKTPLQTAVGTLREGGKVLIGSDSNPLAVMARRGRGQVTVLMFSPELEPFPSWIHRSAFWAKMTAMPPELLTSDQYNVYGGQSIDGVFGAMIDSKQVRKLPIGWLLLLLVGYLVVIGPLDFYWLKKINRQMLTWITFPVYVALFSVLIYFIGYKLRAGETEWNELHVVDVLAVADTGEWRGRTFASVYSPMNATYRLASELPYATLRGEFLGSFAGGQEGSRARVQQRGNNFVADVSVPVWTSQLFVSDWINRDELPLKLTVKRQPKEWLATVENTSDTKVRLASIVLDGQFFELGELPKNDSKTFHLTTGTPLTSFVQNQGNSFANAVSQRQQAFGENRAFIHDIPRSVMAASFVSMLNPRSEGNPYGNFLTPPGFDLSALAAKGDAILLAWVPDYAPIKPIQKFSARRSSRQTLFRLSTPLVD